MFSKKLTLLVAVMGLFVLLSGGCTNDDPSDLMITSNSGKGEDSSNENSIEDQYKAFLMKWNDLVILYNNNCEALAYKLETLFIENERMLDEFVYWVENESRTPDEIIMDKYIDIANSIIDNGKLCKNNDMMIKFYETVQTFDFHHFLNYILRPMFQ